MTEWVRSLCLGVSPHFFRGGGRRSGGKRRSTDPDALPCYYSRLAPFREVFIRGRPILTYHHVGPRPSRPRLKGLYLSPKLFAAHMAELAGAGFAAPPLENILAPSDDSNPRVFLTFDDGFRDVFEHALPVLIRHRFCAIQFLISDFLGKTNLWQQRVGDVSQPLMDAVQVREWLAAGQQIGSHTRTHPWLTRLSENAARQEIAASKKALEDTFGIPVEHFCYPYGDWNQRVRDLVAEAGYRSACTTETGINLPGASPFELKRFTARYPTRNLKAIWAFVRGWQRLSARSRRDTGPLCWSRSQACRR
jgi:peptidoglycan/xylan/chitin deacetylase (PgdA/CDA1 family)